MERKKIYGVRRGITCFNEVDIKEGTRTQRRIYWTERFDPVLDLVITNPLWSPHHHL